jgi:hypothetical protein
MMSIEQEPQGQATDCDPIYTYLTTLFEPSDFVTFRPIETWVEKGKKKSRVLYKQILSIPQHAWLNGIMAARLAAIEAEHGNAFVGVCPRHSGTGSFELAWQIQTVRCLWADVDGCTVEEALERIRAAGLPEPTMIVSSGNGGHLYWKLEEAVETGAPAIGVFQAWTEIRGKKRPIRYIEIEGERIWLDDTATGKSIPANHPKLTEIAVRVQDTCQGIAAAIGGDHTQDLSRLLRLPGTMNRKNGRSGAEPKPCVLIEADATRRYPFELFARYADEAPSKKKRTIVATIKLPVVRKLTPAKTDTLNEKVFACGSAADRSAADFHLCCWALEKGISKTEVWSACKDVGKFAERGEPYFDATWSRAEDEVRSVLYETLNAPDAAVARQSAFSAANPEEPWNNADTSSDERGNENRRPTIYVEPVVTPVAETLAEVTQHLLSAGDCFTRAEQLVVIHEGAIRSVLTSQELAGLLSEHVEFYFIKDQSGQYVPLPASYGNTWLNNHVERSRLPSIRLFTRNPVYTDDWRLLAPGFDQPSGFYYAGPAVEPRNDTVHLDALLHDFCFKTPGDRTNYLAMLITIVLVSRFIGSKPAVLFNGNQPELGKTILAQIISILRDGHPAETASYNANDEEFEKRLGAIVHRGVTTIIIDNAKSRSRNSRIESACLERSITDPVLSFRLLRYSVEIRAENSHIFCITANSPDVSRDLVTRSAVVNLYYEGDPSRRSFSIQDPEGYAETHRLELLGELIGMVERWKAVGMPMSNASSRFNKRGWASIVGGILEANGEPDFLVNAGEAASLLDDTQREFTELIAVLADHPQGLWTAAELVELCNKHGLLTGDLGTGSARSLATKMGTLVGRFVNDTFLLDDGRSAKFKRTDARKGNVYQVFIRDEVPNLEDFAEPMPNLQHAIGSAP